MNISDWLFPIFALAAAATSGGAAAADPQVELKTNMGTIRLELYPEKAPLSVENFLKYVQDGHYDGTIFHRVIENFMIQGGCPMGNGMGDPGYRFADEFGPGLRHDREGLLSMANAGPNTNGSQFFITLVPTPWLNGKHTVFGEVTEGMDVIEKMGAVKTSKPGDKPLTPITIRTVKIERK